MASPLEQNENLRQLIAGVYAAGLVPLARSTGSLWRSVPAHPVRLLIAIPASLGAAAALGLYLVAASVVPLCVGFLLALTSPIMLFVAVTGPFGPPKWR